MAEKFRCQAGSFSTPGQRRNVCSKTHAVSASGSSALRDGAPCVLEPAAIGRYDEFKGAEIVPIFEL